MQQFLVRSFNVRRSARPSISPLALAVLAGPLQQHHRPMAALAAGVDIPHSARCFTRAEAGAVPAVKLETSRRLEAVVEGLVIPARLVETLPMGPVQMPLRALRVISAAPPGRLERALGVQPHFLSAVVEAAVAAVKLVWLGIMRAIRMAAQGADLLLAASQLATSLLRGWGRPALRI